LTSKRIALLVDRILSRLAAALLILVLGVVALVFTIGLFPRTFLGTLVLITVGFPLCLIAEVLGELGFSRVSRTPSARAGGLIGLVALVVLVWWWSASHAPFMRENFF